MPGWGRGFTTTILLGRTCPTGPDSSRGLADAQLPVCMVTHQVSTTLPTGCPAHRAPLPGLTPGTQAPSSHVLVPLGPG